jgi:hypothetical protein
MEVPTEKEKIQVSEPKNTTTDIMRTVETPKALAVPAKDLRLKRKLTMDATSIARLNQVICRAQGELESIEMPPTVAGGPKSTAVAVPILDVVTMKEYLLICNSLIVSAFQRAGSPLEGRYFALRSGEIKAGKRYRQVDVMELELIAMIDKS